MADEQVEHAQARQRLDCAWGHHVYCRAFGENAAEYFVVDTTAESGSQQAQPMNMEQAFT